jgi:phosphoglycerate dehydrogenase-like enzyme
MPIRAGTANKATMAQRIHLHVEDAHSKPPTFRLTRERVAAAQRRNREAVRRVRISHGHDLEALDEWIGVADAVVCAADVLTDPRFPLRRLASAAPRLRWIHVIGAGIEKLLPLDWIHPALTLTNNSGVHRSKMYEFALMALTMVNARVPTLFGLQARQEWRQIFTPCCRGQTLAVIGTGDIGGTFARAGRHLGMTVLGVRRSARPAQGFDKVFRTGELAKLLPRADILVMAAPLTPETQGLIGAKELDAMKASASVINVGRAPTMDYGALAERLEQGKLAGAILDVFNPEPLPAQSPLWRVPNLMIFPHCSSDDEAQYIPLTLDLVLDNARRLAEGRALRNRVNAERAY